ncbi:unnamed protein product [Victoria cruziana]
MQQQQAMHPLQQQSSQQQQQMHAMHQMQQHALHPMQQQMHPMQQQLPQRPPPLPQQQQQQQQQGMHPMVPPQLAAALVSTEHIQAYLDENKQLILAILENQNLGKVADVAQLQNRLQQNLIYLAAIADAQPQLQALQLAQMPQGLPHSATQAGEGHFMQHPQVTPGATPQHPFPPRVQMQFNSPQQMQEHQHHQQHIQQQMLQQQQQFAQNPFGMRPGSSNGVRPEVAMGTSGAAQPLSTGTMLVGSSSSNPMENMQTAGGLATDAQGNKQEAGATGSDNQSVIH